MRSTLSLNSQSMTRVFGYLRVSTVDQNLEKNKMEILKLANQLELGHVSFIEETVTGTLPWRKRKLAEIINSANKGDSIIVSEISRLGRSLLDVMELLSICSQNEINVYSVKGNWRLDSSIQSKIVATVFALASEIERSLISQRTKEALRVKKINGVHLGRPRGVGKSKLDTFRPEIEALLKNGATQRFIARRYNTTPVNLHFWLKKHNFLNS